VVMMLMLALSAHMRACARSRTRHCAHLQSVAYRAIASRCSKGCSVPPVLTIRCHIILHLHALAARSRPHPFLSLASRQRPLTRSGTLHRRQTKLTRSTRCVPFS